MSPRERRTVIAGLSVVAAAVSMRLGIALFAAYNHEKERARVSVTSSSQAQQLIASTNTMRRLLREQHLQQSTQHTLLSAMNRPAAANELAQLVTTMFQDDSLASLTITPENDSTVLGRFRRTALRLRFEAETAGLVQFLASVLTSTTIIRIDGLKLASLQGTADDGSQRIQIDTRVSAWFQEERP